MNISAKDKEIIRELAKKYVDLAAQEINKERIQRIKDMHNLKPVRPPVWIDEIPWHEMDIDGQLILHCESKDGQEVEQFFRRVLFRWKYFQADMVVEDTYYINKAYTDGDEGAVELSMSRGTGLKIQEQTIASSTENNVVSHHYEDQLDTEEKVDALKLPVIRALPEIDSKNLEVLSEVFDGIMPVKLRGPGIPWYAAWDDIVMFRGIQNCLMDMAERPEFIHKLIQKFTDIGISRFAQMEEQGLLDFNLAALHCTPPYTDDVPAKDYDGGKVRMKDIWFRGMAQIFSSASPAMQEEFDLQYMRTLMDRCALTYYGCCEPLDRFIPYLRKIPNMRKIGCSPWSSIQKTAEQVGSDYVIACKPNPAHVAWDFNTDQVKKEITGIVESCLKYKSPYELVLKDISTVNGKPQNLIDWTNTTMKVLDHFYG
jgi:hypothetical protein